MAIVIGIDSRLLEFPGPEVVIGSGPAAQLSLPNDGRIAARHAVMRLVAGRWLIEAQGDAAIRVGDGRPTKVAWLNPGDVIQLSDTGPALTFSPPQPATAAVPPSLPANSLASATSPSATTMTSVLAGSVLVLAIAVLMIAWRSSPTDPPNGSHGAGKPKDNSPKQDVGDKDLPGLGGAGENPAAVEPVVNNAAASLSTVEEATYVVLLEDPQHKRQTRFGMACAIGPRELVTSAYGVAMAVIRGREHAPIAKVQGAAPDQTYQITDIKLYPKFDELVYQVEQFQSEIQKLVAEAEKIQSSAERGSKKQLTKINEDIRHFDAELKKFVPLIGGRDLAVLVVDRDLPAFLPTAAGDATISPGKNVSLVGYPWPGNQPLHDAEAGLQPTAVTAQLSQKQEIQNVKPYLWLVRFGDITKHAGRQTDIWSGSPVVDGKQRLIGVYSRTHPKRDQAGFDPEWHEVTSIDSLGDIK